MEGDAKRGSGRDRERRRVAYCLIPSELGPSLHDLLRDHFRDQPDLDVVVERRGRDRRASPERRISDSGPGAAAERRRILSAAGRRAGERRSLQVSLSVPLELPRRARPYAGHLTFVESFEPSSAQAEDTDSARLVARFQAGEHEVFAILYQRYFDRAYAYLRAALRDPHEAEDATQQVFMKLLDALPRYERRRQPFRAWLFTIVRNQALDLLRRRGRIDVVDPDELEGKERPGEPEPDPAALGWITDHELLLFIERLPEAQKQVLVLRFLLDLTDREIATVLGRSSSDIRRLQSRALSFLRRRLEAVGRTAVHGRRIPWRRVVRKAPVTRMRRSALSP